MKRVLIITYYWPPSGGAGVQRWLKFAKYLRDFGWEPVIYTPENPEAPANDESLFLDIPEHIEVIKTPIKEPYTLYKKFVGRAKDDKIKTGFLSEKEVPSLMEEISVWIRGNFFIPDARKFWINPSIKFLKKYLKSSPVDAMISTGPPHSMHLIALGVKKQFKIPWLADFRDPWTHIDFYDKLKLQKFADRKHKGLEQDVLKNADKVVTVSWNWAKDFQDLGAHNVEVITNGYDEDDFRRSAATLSDKFEMIHIGSMNADRNPEVLWTVLGEFCKKDPSFKKDLVIKLIGQSDIQVLKSIEKNGLEKNFQTEGYMSHQAVIEYAGRARLFLLPLNKTPNVNGIIPGKLFEYLGLNRPVLCIGPPEGDSAKILREAKAGIVINFDDRVAMAKTIGDLWKEFQAGSIAHLPDSKSIEQFTRKNLTKRIGNLLNEMIA